MQLLLVCFIIFFCGVALASPHNPFLFKLKDPVRNIKGFNNGLGITGGTSASIKSVPYQAAVIFSTGERIGSGAIVGKNFILTSGYLVYGYTGLKVRVGSANSSEGGQLIDVEEIILHEKFDYFYSYDVALLKLSTDIKFSKTAKPVKLASKEPKKGTSAVVSGFGTSTASSQNGNYGDLKKGNQKAVERTKCQSYYSGITLDESDTCAFSSSVCPCYYDLGDPLVYKNTLIGYFIGGSYCCQESNPQIYNDVANINKWVKEKMKAAGYDEHENYGNYYSNQ